MIILMCEQRGRVVRGANLQFGDLGLNTFVRPPARDWSQWSVHNSSVAQFT